MSSEGWIKLHRSLLEWEWYDDINVCRLFTHLLLTANHAPGKWKGLNISAGQTVTGRKALSAETKLSEMQIRTALSKLKKTNEITIKTTKHFSIISITNWEKWQQGNQLDNQQVTNKQPTDNQQVTTNNKNNNGKNDKNTIEASQPPSEKESQDAKPKRRTASRIKKDWGLDSKDIGFANERGFQGEKLENLAARFHNHWLGTEKNATSKDWNAKWRTWVLNEVKFSGNRNQSGRQQAFTNDDIEDAFPTKPQGSQWMDTSLPDTGGPIIDHD